MIPKKIHQTCRDLSGEEARLARRAQAKLPGWEYRLWTDAENEQLVAAHFARHLAAYRSIRRGVVKADIARCVYLFAFGGFYLDTDYKLYRAVDEQILSHRCVLPVSRNDDSVFRLGNCVMGSEAGHIFWKDFLDHIFSNPQLGDLTESRIEKTTGPEGLTEFYLGRKDRYKDIYLPPRHLFHPPISRLGFPTAVQKTTFGAHLCWGSWRSKGPLGKLRTIAVRTLTSF